MRIPILFGGAGQKAGFPFPPPPRFARLAHIGGVCASLLGLFFGGDAAAAADFAVAYPGGSAYTINAIGGNPTLTLVRGELYTFLIGVSSSHPFQIVSPAGTTTNNNISSGTITFRVPTNAANYSYRCSIHGFGGQILTIPPPAIRIVNVNVSTNIVVKSTGTNNWSLVPEFKTNLLSSNWLALTVQTNRFANGTNETICGRPSARNVFLRIKALRN